MGNVLLDVNDIASELACWPVEAQRLIAREYLSATLLGNGYRTTVQAIEKYVVSGAPNLRLPELSGEWFSYANVGMVDAFESAIMVAAGEQSPSADAIKSAFYAKPNQERIDFPIGLTGKVAEVCRRAVPTQIFGEAPAGTAETRFANWADLYICDTLRNVVRGNILSADRGAVPFDKLYGSATEVKERAAERGFSKRQLSDAKRELGVRSLRAGLPVPGSWKWALPDGKPSPSDWLRTALANGPVAVNDLTESGKALGFTFEQLRRARGKIKADSHKTSFDGPWQWSLAA